MKTWKAVMAGLLLAMFLASSCAMIRTAPLTEEEEEILQEKMNLPSGD